MRRSLFLKAIETQEITEKDLRTRISQMPSTPTFAENDALRLSTIFRSILEFG